MNQFLFEWVENHGEIGMDDVKGLPRPHLPPTWNQRGPDRLRSAGERGTYSIPPLPTGARRQDLIAWINSPSFPSLIFQGFPDSAREIHFRSHCRSQFRSPFRLRHREPRGRKREREAEKARTRKPRRTGALAFWPGQHRKPLLSTGSRPSTRLSVALVRKPCNRMDCV